MNAIVEEHRFLNIAQRLRSVAAGKSFRMLIAAVIAFCVVLAVLAFLAPRLSRYFQRAGDKPLQLGERASGKAPGKLGRWLRKPFEGSRKAVRKSGSKGREERAKSPI